MEEEEGCDGKEDETHGLEIGNSKELNKHELLMEKGKEEMTKKQRQMITHQR